MPELVFSIDTSQFVKNLVGQFRAMRDASFFAIDESTDIFIDKMKSRIKRSSPSGREYHFRYASGFQLSRYGPTKEGAGRPTHIASAPGEPPAILSGELLGSFSKRTIFSRGHTRIISYIENHSKHALWMEYGTLRTGWGGPIHPRPFMAPVVYDAALIHKMLIRVRNAMKNAGHAYGAR